METNGGKLIPLLFMCLVSFAGLSIVYFTLRLGISPMPSNSKAVEAMVRTVSGLLHAADEASQSGITLHECGAGFGTLAFALADAFPSTAVVAYERSWVPLMVSRVRQVIKRRPNLTFEQRDFLSVRFGQADILTCFLFTGGMQRLKNKLFSEASQVKVVSQTFAFRGMAAEQELTLDDFHRTRIYVYSDFNSGSAGPVSSG
jgi:hypothetical protein